MTLADRALTPTLVRGDPVVAVDIGREHVITRLTVNGADRFSVDGKAVYGDDGVMAITALRVASDGRLYQLRTSPKVGASVARYALR
jgi:hypothetical protein